MALSQAFLTAMVGQIAPEVEGAYIRRITRYAPGSYAFHLSRSKDLKLVISLDNAAPYLTLTRCDLPGSGQTSNFFQILKKELNNAFIRKINIDEVDRIIFFTLDVITPAYEKREYRLVLELIPMMANLLLIDQSNKIIALHKPSKSLDVARPLLVNMEYTPPQRVNKVTPFSRIEKAMIEKKNLDPKEIIKQIDLFANEDGPYSSFPFYDDQRSVRLSPESFFDRQFQALGKKRQQELFKDVFDLTSKKLKQIPHKIRRLETELQKAKKDVHLTEVGNLLLTYYDEIAPHQKKVILNEIEIPLDPLKTVFENARAYFKKAKKAKVALDALQVQIDEANNELVYFEQVAFFSQTASEEELKEIKTELALNGYFPRMNHRVKKPAAVHPYVITVDEYRIGFGKNNLQNDYLTFHLARPKDYFFHTANTPSAHVIIFDENPPKHIIQLAAEIALLSSGLPSGEVQLTDQKYVKKGDRPGRVHLLNHQTLYIREISEATKLYYEQASRYQGRLSHNARSSR
ncbi:MAG: NFACT family protein [Bacilli bacterium]